MRTEYFCSLTTPQVFWQSSAPGALNTLVTSSVVLYWITRATLMSLISISKMIGKTVHIWRVVHVLS